MYGINAGFINKLIQYIKVLNKVYVRYCKKYCFGIGIETQVYISILKDTQA